MEFRDYLRVLRNSWLLIVVLVVAGAFAGGIVGLVQPKQYQATAKAFVSVQSAQTLSDLTSGVTFAQQAARGYADITETSYVLQPVIDSLDLRTTPSGLSRRVEVAVADDSPVITVTVTDAFATRAAKTANAVVSQLSTAAVALTPESGTTTATNAVKLTAVDPAVVDRSPIGLRLPVAVLIGAVLGLVLAVLAGLVRELLDTRIRTRQDLDRVTDTPVLGTTFRDPQVARTPLVVDVSGVSPSAEAYRSLRTNLLFLELDDSRRSLVLTSSIEGEGKSTTAANLALAVASLGVKVLLVDADLRRPRLARYFGLEGSVGLTDVLIGSATLDQAVQRFGQDDLEVLPAGTIPPNPNEQMQSAAMHDLVTRLHARYDLVVFDSPPLLAVSDAALLSRLAGGVLMVAAAGRVRRPQLEAALETLERAGTSAGGLILTMMPRSGQDAYGYGYGDDPAADAPVPSEPTRSVPDAVKVLATALRARPTARPDSSPEVVDASPEVRGDGDPAAAVELAEPDRPEAGASAPLDEEPGRRRQRTPRTAPTAVRVPPPPRSGAARNPRRGGL